MGKFSVIRIYIILFPTCLSGQLSKPIIESTLCLGMSDSHLTGGIKWPALYNLTVSLGKTVISQAVG